MVFSMNPYLKVLHYFIKNNYFITSPFCTSEFLLLSLTVFPYFTSNIHTSAIYTSGIFAPEIDEAKRHRTLNLENTSSTGSKYIRKPQTH